MKLLWCDFKEEDFVCIEELSKHGIEVLYTEYLLDSKKMAFIDNVYSVDGIVFSYVNTYVDGNLLEPFKNLKFILTRTAGCDHIDINYCSGRGIKVCCIDGYSTRSTAEYTIALTLALLRKFKPTMLRVSEGLFQRDMGEDLYGKKVGVVGTGSIGTEVAKLFTCLGAEVVCWSFSGREDLKKYGIKYTSLEELYKTSDIVTFHLRLSNNTKHIFNKKSLDIVKRGVYIINTARGSLIDIEAVYIGIKYGLIGGAAFDCFEAEDFFIRNTSSGTPEKVEIIRKLINLPNVIFTPHNAFNTLESKKKDLDFTLRSILHYKKNNKCLYECPNFAYAL
jgi:D-lactate dehydrogenase